MRTLRWFAPLLLLFIAPSIEAALVGSISGLVRDERGIAQMGAVVTLLTPEGRVAKRVYTDHNGVFQFGRLFPGAYSIRVALDRFLPALKENVVVQPDEKKILDVRLRGLFSTLRLVFPGGAEIRDMSDDWKWVLRTSSSTRPALRLLPVEDRETRAVFRKLSGRFEDTRAYAELSAGAGARQTGLANETDLGTAFAVATSMFGNNNVIVSGNLGYGSTTGTPATAFRTSYSREMGGGTPEVSLTVRQLHVPIAAGQAIFGLRPEESGPSLETFTLGFGDHLKLGDVARLEYGFLYESVRFLNTLNYVSPYGRFVFNVDDKREVQLRYASGVPHSQNSVNAPESLRHQVSSLGMFPRIALRDGRPTVQRTDHVEIAYRERMGDDGLLELAVYRDTLNDTALSAMVPAGHYAGGDILPDLFSQSSTLNAGRFDSSGYRVSYARKIRDRLQAAIGYGSSGVVSPGANQLTTPEAGELRRSLEMKRAQLIMASVSTKLPKTDTEVITAYQWLSQLAAIAPDLYNDFAARSDPGLNVIVRQPLPFSGGLPGRLEATANFNNLMKAGYIPIQTFDGQQMYLLQAIRSYRGALSFVF